MTFVDVCTFLNYQTGLSVDRETSKAVTEFPMAFALEFFYLLLLILRQSFNEFAH